MGDFLQINLFVPFYPYYFPILEKLNASSALALCIAQDESLLKAMEVYVVVAPFLGHVPPSIIGSVLKLVETINMLHHASHLGTTSDSNKSNNFSSVSVVANLESGSFIVDLENGLEESCTLTVSLQDLDMRLITMKHTQSFWICTRAFKVTSRLLKNSDDMDLINVSPNGLSQLNNGCLMLHYDGDLSIWLTDLDLHCYPHIIGLLIEFFDKLPEYSSSHLHDDKNQEFVVSNSNNVLSGSYFGCSNFYDTCSSDWESISVDHYPFVTIHNDRSLLSLESSLININPDWKKVLNIREGKINCSKKEFQKLSVSDPHLVVINLDLRSIRLHLHDSSSIVAYFTLPTAKSSISIHESCLDVLCSTEGLSLSSQWFPQTLQDSLWGPALLNLSLVINIRVRKGNHGMELDFSIQNVSCILPTEFLAVLIGYFSMPDWNSNAKESSGIDCSKDTDSFPFHLQLQMYFTFIENSDSDILLKEISLECSVPPGYIGDQNYCLNVFGRDLSLHHILWKDNASEVTSISIIAPCSGDIWITIPYGSDSPSATCMMSKVNKCQFIVEGSEILGCFDALLDVIDQLTSVENLSMCFTSDVSEFLNSKDSFKENHVLQVPIESLSVSFTEIRCSVESMSVELYSDKIQSNANEHIAKTDMKFTCSVSLKNEKPLSLDVSFTC
ncbi:unnamed protein product [Lactuca virosa]|uniref:Uncharacterized protein n=1 Tax=Lactuca virosa TaxID=75947 RepID=A0AAU9NAT0_9ASTR|nr:unnamed protein product [Lactuca virosa]